jgi:subtilisin family serine protease
MAPWTLSEKALLFLAAEHFQRQQIPDFAIVRGRPADLEMKGSGEVTRTVDGRAEAYPDRAAIEAVPGVETVMGDLLVGLADDPNQPQQWWLENKGTADAGGSVGVVGADVKAAAGWRVSRGAGVVVAVLDTGVEPTHPDLIDRMWTNSDEVCNNGLDDDRNGFVDDCAGWDFGSNDKNPAPDTGVTSSNHGTHVAGIVAASSNGVGVVGLAPEATIMPVKLMATSGVMTAKVTSRRPARRRPRSTQSHRVARC